MKLTNSATRMYSYPLKALLPDLQLPGPRSLFWLVYDPLGAAMWRVRRRAAGLHHGGEDNVTAIRIRVVAIALSIALGFVGGTCSTHRSAKDQNVSGMISSRRMADGKEWTTANLNVNASPSYCYDDAEPNCRQYGRLCTWESAQRVCQSLRDGWRLPTDNEWRHMAKRYGGVSKDSADKKTSDAVRRRVEQPIPQHLPLQRPTKRLDNDGVEDRIAALEAKVEALQREVETQKAHDQAAKGTPGSAAEEELAPRRHQKHALHPVL